MSRASALEVRWAPGKRDARAHWGPVLQRLRTIGRSAPVSGRALAHARPRAQPLGALRPGAGVVGRPDPGQAERTPGAITPTALGALHNRVAEAQEDAHRREAAPPGALRPSQPSVPTVVGLEVGDSASASWAHAPEAASSASAAAASVTVAPSMPPPPTVVGTETAGPRAQVGFSSASTCAGSCSGCVPVRPTMAGRPQAIAARDQSSALRPNPETQASQGTPQGRRERAFATASVRPPMEGRRNDGRTRHTPAVALRSRRLRLRCGVRDQRWSCRTKPAARLAGHSSGCWPQTSGRGGRKLSGAATHAASYSSLSNGTQRLLPRDGAMVSPHTVLFALYTVWDQRWNHPIVCLDSSPTTKSVGLRKVPCHRPHLRVNWVDDNMTAISQFGHKSQKLTGSHQPEPVTEAA